jgi:hypothetical protein
MKHTVRKIFIPGILFFLLISFASAQSQPASPPQRADISVTLNEQFFDAFLETVFKNFKPVDFSIAKNKSGEVKFENASYRKSGKCDEVIRLEKEIAGVRTAVRFRDGRVMAPLAFSGSYDVPLFGCVDFTGWAETNVELNFDAGKQALLARVKIVDVNLNGVTGLGSGVLARMIQSSVDKKVNPTEILNAEKLSFIFPLESMGGNLRLRATGMQPEVTPGELKIKILYEIGKE